MQDISNLRNWCQDGRFGRGFLGRSPENVWDPELGDKASIDSFITTTITGDRILYFAGTLYLAAAHYVTVFLHRIESLGTKVTTQEPQPSAPASTNQSDPAPDEENNIQENGIYSLSGATETKMTASVVTVVASALLVVPILVLYFVPSLGARLALVFVFTVLMAAVMTFGLALNAEKVLAISTA